MFQSPEGFIVHQYSCRLHIPTRMWGSINSSAPLAGDWLNSTAKCPLASHTVTSEACFLDPHTPKISSLQKIWRIFFSSTYGRLKGLVPLGRQGCETPCYRIHPDPIPNLVGSSGTPLPLSVVLFHPVPAFITVLPVLFGFDDLSVAPTEETHLSESER